ncbi:MULTISPECIES: alpha/beta fold hydrolase [Gordonia]|jgi:pimeloyl-ACP methyl ester carboxylesterase|uniref:Alpha/beta hydrolase n=1 Tax=Gordonia alkanivorans CGMCC 6845 TaxID=1423140 RepID=W9DH84_9ACTN|nr:MULTISPECIES: alpha/beta hydrolase [Gordonia]ETA07797.1 alpha/beta hydrolase [Gordonia alkanivorans CGMCC 6845]MDH3009187.1 alpha/beta hydrolase [Gordonia alkanivorans]MDH3013013.1 alpha/beta hydrolase [Gordonia alkanivorans]MDH3015157.1 alpha/beta hydrolase [Gordonia alkanivorans]MDH3021329.1 alpha/beta hydrolase [Gordonia alkanivorans]
MIMGTQIPVRATIPGVEHHDAAVNGTVLHYVSAGREGSPIVLVHGFPESWWAFHKLIPLLAGTHRVFALDLRGFGDSAVAGDDFTSSMAAEDIHQFVRHLAAGPVHVLAQDISGGAVYRFVSGHPELVRSLVGVEMGLAGFGLEGFGDVTQGGSWHIGALAAPGIPDLLIAGREREVLGEWAFPTMTTVEGAVGEEDLDEFVRVFARDGGWRGAAGLYRSMLAEGEEFRARAAVPLAVPMLAVGSSGGAFTAQTLAQISGGPLSAMEFDEVGHHVALEAPDRLATAVADFLADVDG